MLQSWPELAWLFGAAFTAAFGCGVGWTMGGWLVRKIFKP